MERHTVERAVAIRRTAVVKGREVVAAWLACVKPRMCTEASMLLILLVN